MSPRRPLLHAARIADIVLFYPALLLVIWGELAGPDPQVLGLLALFNDKLLHFLAYFALAAMAAAAFRERRPVFFAGVALMVLGGVLEILQGFTGREVSVYDEIANVAGVLVGGFGARAIVEPLQRRLAPPFE